MRTVHALSASGRRHESDAQTRSHRSRIAWPSILLLAALVTASGCMIAPSRSVRFVRVAGATEVVQIKEANLDFIARVDTGATNSSLHALNLQIDGEADAAVANVGKPIHFQTANAQGETRMIDGEIAGVVEVRSAQGVEYRYAVPLNLVWKGSYRRVLVNLRDRSEMEHKLLVGRDWIHGNVVIDVERTVEK